MRISDWSSDVCSSDLGIARAGWDRTGWGRRRHLGELWMRMRDRRAPLAVLVLATAYLALGAWGMGAALHWLTGIPPPPLAPLLHVLLSINAILLARSEEHTSELQSLMRNSYAVFCLKKKIT